MKRLLILLVILNLVSCARAEIAISPNVVNTITISTSTSLPPTSNPAPTSIPATQEAPCNPLREDFCITNGHLILQRPIHPPGNDLVDPTYLYGSTAEGTREPHHGVEFPNSSGTPVYAAAQGTVIFAGADKQAIYSPWPNFYGNLIVLEHKDELFTLYAHLSKMDVKVGQKIYEGEKIGEVGRTGVAIGSHLHFEVRRGKAEDYFATQNPELWLAPAKDITDQPFGTLMIFVANPDHSLTKYAEFTIQYYQQRSKPPVKSYYGTTYSADMLNGEENAVLGELSAGQYRIAIERKGQVYERWVEVESGKLTQVVFIVK